MSIHSTILAWEIPWTEEPGGLQSIGSQRVRHDLAIEHDRIALGFRGLEPNPIHSWDLFCILATVQSCLHRVWLTDDIVCPGKGEHGQ